MKIAANKDTFHFHQNMQQLNLPPYPANIRTSGTQTQIYDILRRKFVALTPEEWVRQNFIHFLVEHKGYSPTLMANEAAIELNGMSRRCDTVLYQREGLRPRMIIEYKAPSVQITQRVFNQICRYNMVLQVEYLIVSNGINHYCCHINYADNSFTFLPDIPDYKDL